jgi:hypothetical protein
MKPIPRRTFLRQSSLLILGAPLSGGPIFSPAGRAIAASDKVRVGLIGCGGMGKGDLSTFFLNPEVECPVVCDVDDAKLAEATALVNEKRGAPCDTVKDFRRVLDRKDLDAVIVATPDHSRAADDPRLPGRQGRLCGEAACPQHP